jgi:hypothetical protein
VTNLPETDLTLAPSYPAARRFLWMLFGDDLHRYQANQACDDAPRKLSPHTFVLKGTVNRTITAVFDDCAARLAEANRVTRTSILIQLDLTQALVAHYQGTPQHGQGGRAHGFEGLGAALPSVR